MAGNISSQHPGQAQRASCDETRRTATCTICRAVYAPSQPYEYLALISSIALESALMSMSHFCFRCRRPACPQCWNEIHGVCAACVLEAHLPSRSASASLNGTPSVSAPQNQGQSRGEPLPLVCIHDGRFQRPAALSSRSVASPVRLPRQAVLPIPYTERSVGSHTVPNHSTRKLPPLPRDHIAEVDTQPARREDIIELDTQPSFRRSTWMRVEHALIVCVSFILLLLLLIIFLALIFPSANAFIVAVLHIDIQAEIAYLLQLVTHLH